MKAGAIIPAAGSGRRMGGVRKAFMEVGGKPLLQHCVEVFLAHPRIETVVVPLSRADIDSAPAWLEQPRIVLVEGGEERADSVRAGVKALADDIDAVVIHDAARPLINAMLIDRVLEEVQRGRSATVAIPVSDTLHQVGDDREIRATPDRSSFWRAQTPQAFPRDVLELAFSSLPNVSLATDEAGLVAGGGWKVVVVPGEPWNVKVTTIEDLLFVETALREGRR